MNNKTFPVKPWRFLFDSRLLMRAIVSMRRATAAGFLLLITGCQPWNRFWDVGVIGGDAVGVYYPVTANLNFGEDTQVIGKNQASYAFGRTIVPGGSFKVTVDNGGAGQSCMVDNTAGIALTGNNANHLFCANAFYAFYGSTGNEQFTGVAAATGGSIVLAGSIANSFTFNGADPGPVTAGYSGGGTNDIFAVKLNNIGEVEWYNYFGTNGPIESANALTASTDGGFIILGTAASDIPSLHGKTPVSPFVTGGDMIVLKISAAGVLQWYTFLGTTGSENGAAISEAPDGSIYVLSSGGSVPSIGGIAAANSPTGTGDMYVVKLMSNGSVVWFNYVGSSGGDTGFSLAATPDNGVVVGGLMQTPPVTNLPGITHFNNPPPGGGQDGAVVKLSAAGNGEWAAYIGSTAGADQINSVRTAPDGSIYVAGVTAGTLSFANYGTTPTTLIPYSAANDPFILKLSAAGTPLWLNYIGGAGSETSGPIAVTFDGGIVVVGGTPAALTTLDGLAPLNNYAGGSADIIQARFTGAGNLIWWQMLGSTAGDGGNAVIETKDRGIAVAGSFGANLPSLKGFSPKNNYGGAGTDAFVIKVNASGGF
jgi:hypothetical protein